MSNQGNCVGRKGLASGYYALNCGSLGDGSIMLPGSRVTCNNALMGTALSVPWPLKVKAKSPRNPAATRGRAVWRHVFMAVIWYCCLSGKPHRITHTHELPLVLPLSAPFSCLTHSHTSMEKLHTHACTCVTRPVFHWGLIDWKMTTDVCVSRALFISQRHGVYHSGPAPDPNTSLRQPVTLHC